MSHTYRATLYRHIHAAEDTHFWFLARNAMIVRLVSRYVSDPRNISFLDVGCGTGGVLAVLERLGFRMTGLDVNAKALTYAKQRTRAALVRSTIFRYRPRRQFSALGAFDVMEHIRDDGGFLRHCRRLLTNRGYLFLTVPAHPGLWTSVDELSGHQRRYTRRGLHDVLESAGFSVVRVGYWNSFLLPFYVLWRLVGKSGDGDPIQSYLTTPHPLVNRMLCGVLSFESLVLPGMWPFGATLVAVAQKV